MPTRTIPLVTNEAYHVLNRGNGSIQIFKSKHDFQKLIQTILYYRNASPPLKFSHFTKLPLLEKDRLTKELELKKDFCVEIIAYCLIPNHFHLIVKQINVDGIMNFMRRVGDSYARYFNTKYKRRGGLFEGRFRAVRIENDYQLLHLSRYIHLNPYSSFLVKDSKNLKDYPFSSLPEYLDYSKEAFCKKEIVLDQFKNPEEYEKFILDQANYQRTLEMIKHQILEE